MDNETVPGNVVYKKAEALNLNRRSFLGGLIAAPAIVRASSLMPLWVPPEILYLDGLHDDASAVQAWMLGRRVRRLDGELVTRTISGACMLLSSGLVQGQFPVTFDRCNFFGGRIGPGLSILHAPSGPKQGLLTVTNSCFFTNRDAVTSASA